jgi:hypothetical protein
MGLIRIISDVDEKGRLHIPETLSLKKGKVELIIKSLDDDHKIRPPSISYSDHYCGKIMTESLSREDIDGNDGR